MFNATQGALTVDTRDLAVGGVEYRGSVFYLQRIVFHGPAEHLMAGKRQALELQLVHREAPNSGAPMFFLLAPYWGSLIGAPL